MKKRLILLLLSVLMTVSIGAIGVCADESEVSISSEDEVIEENQDYEVTNIKVDATNFPDPNFRKFIKEFFDYDGDGYVPSDRFYLATLDVMSIPAGAGNQTYEQRYGKISSLKGVEYFTGLEKINLGDLSLSILDLSKNTKLKTVSGGKINKLILPSSVEELSFTCTGTTFDATKLVNVRNITIEGTTLEYVNLNYCSNIYSFTCNSLKSIAVSNNKSINRLTLENGRLTSLNLSGCVNLNRLYCNNNQITSLVVPTNGSISYFYVNDNKLTKLDLSPLKSLWHVNISNNLLTSIDITRFTGINVFICQGNKIKVLDISTNGCLLEVLNNERDSYGNYACGNNKHGLSYDTDGSCKIIPTKNHNHTYTNGVCDCGKVANGLAKVRGVWGYYVNGNLQTTKSGIVRKAASSDTNWYYVSNGVYNTKANGIARKADGSSTSWYFVKNGIYTKASGIAQKADGSSTTWYYVFNGVYKKSTGISKKADGSGTAWYYVYNGIYTKATGISKKADSTDAHYYYVKSGVLSRVDAIAPICKSTNGKLYYVKAGIYTQVTGKVTVAGKVYKINNGVVVS